MHIWYEKDLELDGESPSRCHFNSVVKFSRRGHSLYYYVGLFCLRCSCLPECYATPVDTSDASVRNGSSHVTFVCTYICTRKLRLRRLSHKRNWGLKISVRDGWDETRLSEPKCISQIRRFSCSHRNISLDVCYTLVQKGPVISRFLV